MTKSEHQSSESLEIDRIYSLQRKPENLQRLKDSTARERIVKLRKIEKYLLNEGNLTACANALWKDLHKSREEVIATELSTVFSTIQHTTSNLKRWMMDEPVGKPLALMGTNSHVRYEPKGQVLIISPWNFPIQLLLNPVIHAVAAGNAVLVKPSEMAPAASAFLAGMFADLFPQNEIAVVEGGVEVATALLQKKFDHVFFTGSPRVGKIVMRAAAEHLTSVTLELGGKSPVVIDEQVKMKSVAEKIVWGKCVNAGQTCIAPDYALVPENRVDEFVAEFKNALHRFYGSEDKSTTGSPDYGKLINAAAVSRMKSLVSDAIVKGAEVLLEGQVDEENQTISPFLLTGVTGDMKVMQEEIFGPVLPIITYQDWKTIPATIQNLERPLALYIMSNSQKRIDYLLQRTISGGVGINDMLITIINPYLPFGGVNHSGMGKTNGRHGFLAFSNERGVIKRNWFSFKMLYPPYKKSIFRWLLRLSRM